MRGVRERVLTGWVTGLVMVGAWWAPHARAQDTPAEPADGEVIQLAFRTWDDSIRDQREAVRERVFRLLGLEDTPEGEEGQRLASFTDALAGYLSRGEIPEEVFRDDAHLGFREHESPLVRWFAVQADLNKRGMPADGSEEWAAASRGLRTLTDDPIITALVAYHDGIFPQKRHWEWDRRWRSNRMTAFKLAAMGELTSPERDLLWRFFVNPVINRSSPTDADREERDRTMLSWDEGTDPWIKHAARGATLVDKAWEARGTAFAGLTSDEQFEQFHALLAEAYTHLNTAWTIDPTLSQAPTELIAVAMGGGTPPQENEFIWFERAIDAQIDNFRIYSALAHAMRPRWGGSVDELIRFGRWITREDLDGASPAYAMQSVLHIIRDETGDDGAFGYEGYPELLRDYYDACVRRAPHATPEQRDLYLSTAALVAVEMGEDGWAHDQLTALGGQLVGYELNKRRVRYTPYSSELVILTSDLSDAAARPFALDEQDKHAEAHATWQALRADLPADASPVLARALEQRAFLAARQASFDRGETVDLLDDPEMLGWGVESKWTREGDGPTLASPGAVNTIDDIETIVSLGRFGSRYRVELDFEIDGSLGTGSGFGLRFNIGQPFSDEIRYRSVLIRRHEIASYGYRHFTNARENTDRVEDGRYRMVVELDAPNIRVWINDKPVFDEPVRGWEEGDDRTVGTVGLIAYEPMGTILRAERMTIRRLSDEQTDGG